jgi:hypothetical protein
VPSNFLLSATFGYKTVVRREVNQHYLQEQREYKEQMKDLRKRHLQEYWQRQTQVENAYLERYKSERIEKQKRDMDRWRTAICKIAMHTKKQIDSLTQKEARLLERMRIRDIKDTKKAIENKMMLDVMQIDSRKWPTLSDLNTKVDENVVLPSTILNYGEYQKKL